MKLVFRISEDGSEINDISSQQSRSMPDCRDMFFSPSLRRFTYIKTPDWSAEILNRALICSRDTFIYSSHNSVTCLLNILAKIYRISDSDNFLSTASRLRLMLPLLSAKVP